MNPEGFIMKHSEVSHDLLPSGYLQRVIPGQSKGDDNVHPPAASFAKAFP